MKRKNEDGEYEFGIYEVFYKDTGEIEGWAQDPLTPVCSSEEDLLYEMKLMLEAFKKDTVLYTEE